MARFRSQHGEVVLLPGGATEVFGTGESVGPHTVIISGILNLGGYEAISDDSIRNINIVIDLEEVEWQKKYLQGSSLVTWADIYSGDSDEVDHSRWQIKGVNTGHVDVVRGDKVARLLRLSVPLGVQGVGNTIERVGFQVMANGTLLDPRIAIRRAHQTSPIG